MASHRILIIGLSAGGAAGLPAALVGRIMAADLLVGGQRQLGYFPDYRGETLTITTTVEPVAERLQEALAAGQRAVVLASGDPLCYGIGATLRRYLPAEAVEIIPAPTAFQMAFAALAEPWAEAALLSAHARPLIDVVGGVLTAPKAAILTDNKHTPAVIARALLDAGLTPECTCAICENLGSVEQRIVWTKLDQVGQQSYAPLNVFVVWREAEPGTGDFDGSIAEESVPLPVSPGLPDEAFSTSGSQLTKREVRLLSLAELALGPHEVLWDIGAGSGAVGLEAARSQPTAIVYAVEKRTNLIRHLQENLRRFPAPNYQWVEGTAPDAIADWPDPHAVFVGGSGGRLETIIALARRRLQPGGRLVINLATLENLQTVRHQLPDARVTQAQINRSVPILEMLRFEALNPIFIVSWRNGVS